MTQKPSMHAKIKERLDHVRSMPTTEMRKREILSLERSLAQASKDDAPKPAKRKTASKIKEPVEPKVKPEKPLKEVEHLGTHRRVIVRTKTNRYPEQHQETQQEAKERENRTSSIRSLVDGYHPSHA